VVARIAQESLNESPLELPGDIHHAEFAVRIVEATKSRGAEEQWVVISAVKAKPALRSAYANKRQRSRRKITWRLGVSEWPIFRRQTAACSL
jgi:hypothetical protein